MHRKKHSGTSEAKAAFDNAIHFVIDEAKRVGDPIKLAEPVRTVYFVQGVQGIVDNGGLQYFFAWDWEGQPSYSVFIDAYRKIGAETEADCLAAAVSSFPFADPNKRQDLRRKYMDQFLLKEGGTVHRPDSPFERYDICGSETVWQLLSDYISVHAAAFPG